jgi:hypothetical protein
MIHTYQTKQQESSKDLAPSSFAFAPNKVAQIAFCDIKIFYYGAKIIFAT